MSKIDFSLKNSILNVQYIFFYFYKRSTFVKSGPKKTLSFLHLHGIKRLISFDGNNTNNSDPSALVYNPVSTLKNMHPYHLISFLYFLIVFFCSCISLFFFQSSVQGNVCLFVFRNSIFFTEIQIISPATTSNFYRYILPLKF